MSGANELLMWARGTGLEIALFLFISGSVLRLIEIYSLGRKHDLAPPRQRAGASGWATRSLLPGSVIRRSATTVVLGYVFHIGLLITLLLFAPHIELIRSLTGLHWPALPTPVVDAAAVVTILALIGLLIHRFTDPVKRHLTTRGDYLGWLLTLLPVLTGYMAYHHLLLPYTTMLALHILSAELLLAALPFTKLAHAITTWSARWFNGDIHGRKGVAS